MHICEYTKHTYIEKYIQKKAPCSTGDNTDKQLISDNIFL